MSLKNSLPDNLDTKKLHREIIETKKQANAINPSFESLQNYSLEDIGRLKMKAKNLEMELEASRADMNKRAEWHQ